MSEPESRIPPHDLRAEAAVLSAVLVDPVALAKVSPLVRPEAFYAEAHRRIFEAAESIAAEGRPVDVVQVATWLQDHDRLGQVGGFAYLSEIPNAAPVAANVEHYAETVARKARVRGLLLACHRILAQGYAPIEDEDLFLDYAEAAIHDVVTARHAAAIETMRTALRRAFQKISDAQQRALTDRYTGIPTGLTVLDDATGGLHDGEQSIIAARPGAGKTALAMNIASNVAARGHGVVVFSLEMPNEQIAMRALCSAAGVDVRKARIGAFDNHDLRAVTAVVEEASRPGHYYLVDTPCTLLDIRGIVRARQADMAKTKTKLGLVVVDYAQLMEAKEGIRSREEAVAINARGLKMLAKECHAHVLLLSQLNRAVEARQDKRPMLSDLRESGALEEAADCVIGMYRDDYYDKASKTPGIVELLLLKHRHGPQGTVMVGFKAQSTTFYNLDDHGSYDDGGRYGS